VIINQSAVKKAISPWSTASAAASTAALGSEPCAGADTIDFSPDMSALARRLVEDGTLESRSKMTFRWRYEPAVNVMRTASAASAGTCAGWYYH
jgi:hypothetical protein